MSGNSDLAETLAWQLALRGRLDANPDWDPEDPAREGVLLCTVRLANGTAEGIRLEVTGRTTNEVYRAMSNRILEHYCESASHTRLGPSDG